MLPWIRKSKRLAEEVADTFKDYDANVFVSLISHANAARSFLQAANNEIDIKKLLITKKERLIITNSNLSLFTEADTLKFGVESNLGHFAFCRLG